MSRTAHIVFRGWLILMLAILPLYQAHARSFLRDAEIEHTLRLMTDPILAAADINQDAVRIFLINDDSINAFVAGGMNIFFHTGLILKADTPEMLMGVIAHETGHIAGAHLSQLAGISEDATLGALLSTILGAAAAIGGSGDAGAAIISAGQNSSLRTLLSAYRGNEQQADQAAMRYLEAINLSPKGMIEMFELLRQNERRRFGDNADPYLRTHPLTTDRISSVRTAAFNSTLPAKTSPAIRNAHARMVAKLYAFLEKPAKTFARYPASDKSEAGHLARAVAHFRTPDIDKALYEMDALIALSPDAFSYDLKGQILFEHNRIDDAVKVYEKAATLAPDNALILTDLGKSLLGSSQPQPDKAISALEKAADKDTANATTFQQLSIAYGKQGDRGRSLLARARESALKNNPEDTIRFASQAKELLKNSAALLKAEDLIADAKRLKEEREK